MTLLAEDEGTTILLNVWNSSSNDTVSHLISLEFSTAMLFVAVQDNGQCSQPSSDLTNVGFKNDGCIESGSYIVMSAYQSIDYPTHLPAIPLPDSIALAFNITLINLQPSFCVCQFGSEFST